MPTCPICSSLFESTKPATYCSSKCRQKAHRMRHATPIVRLPSKTQLAVEAQREKALVDLMTLTEKDFGSDWRIAQAKAALEGPEALRRHIADRAIAKAFGLYHDMQARENKRRAEWDALTLGEQKRREQRRQAQKRVRDERHEWLRKARGR